MNKKADFYTNKILSNLNGEIKYYTGGVLIKSQKVKGATYSKLSKLSDKARQKILSQIEKVLEERAMAYENIEEYKYNKESFIKEWSQEEISKYEEKMFNKYGDINSLESMDEYLSKNNKSYIRAIEGFEAVYGADSEEFLKHKEAAINHFKKDLVNEFEDGKEKILNKADKKFNKLASRYLGFDRKREFLLSKLNEKTMEFDEFAKSKEEKAFEELELKEQTQEMNKGAHDQRMDKLNDLGKQTVEKAKDVAIGAGFTAIGVGAYAVEGAVKVTIDAKNVGKEKVEEIGSKAKNASKSVLNKVSGAKQKLLDTIDKSKKGISKSVNDYKKKVAEYTEQFGGKVKGAYSNTKTKIGEMANSVKSKFQKEDISEKRENKFLSKVNLRERLGKVKDKVCNLGIKEKLFGVKAEEIEKNTDYSKLLGGIKGFEYDGKNVVFNLAPGKLNMGKVKWDRQVHIPMVYDENTKRYIIDYNDMEIISEGGGFNKKGFEKEEQNIESIISKKLSTVDKKALKNCGKIIEHRKKDVNGRNFIRYIDSKSGDIVFVATEYTEIGAKGKEIKKYRCQKTLSGIPELEGIEPKGLLDIGEIDEKDFSKQVKLFSERSKEIESEKAKEEKSKAKEEKSKEIEKEPEFENEAEREPVFENEAEKEPVFENEAEREDDYDLGI